MLAAAEALAGHDVLLMTNSTGHPALALPNGFREDGTPLSISFIGKLFGQADMMTVGKAYRDATGFHLRHPAKSAV